LYKESGLVGMAKGAATIVNSLGLHARPSAALTKTASRFKSELWITAKGRRVNGKSIMGVMMLAAAKGVELQLETVGEDDAAALQAVTDLIASGFGEGN
jgi:phosphocarrier protein HPr